MQKKSTVVLFVILTILLAACSSTKSQAAATVENYLTALTDKDEALLVSHICSEYEFEALLEFDSFSYLKTQLQDVSCEEVSSQDGQADVVCQGSIEATYGNEIRSFDLSHRTYHLIQENGSWLICGYDEEQ
jgi:hypothetical protein